MRPDAAAGLDAEAEIDALVAVFYGAFDNREGRAPAAAALRELFIPEGRVVRISAEGVAAWSVEAFIAPRVALLTDGSLTDFHEWEVEGETTLSGNIAARRSRYRKRGMLHGASYEGEGRKFFQLCREGAAWRIVSVLWEDDES